MRLIIGLVALLLVSAVVGVGVGETSIPTHGYLVAFADPSSAVGEILWQIRGPRVVAAALVGAALGLSGAVMQGLLRNPLADPGVLGVSAVSACRAARASHPAPTEKQNDAPNAWPVRSKAPMFADFDTPSAPSPK